MDSIPGLGRSSGPATQPSILAWIIRINRGAWQATVYRVTKSWTLLKQLSTHDKHFSFSFYLLAELGPHSRMWAFLQLLYRGLVAPRYMGSQLPSQGLNPHPLHWNAGELPRKSPNMYYYSFLGQHSSMAQRYSLQSFSHDCKAGDIRSGFSSVGLTRTIFALPHL